MNLGIDEAVPTKAECDAALRELQNRRVRNGLATASPNNIAPNGPSPVTNGLAASGPGVATSHFMPTREPHAVIGASS